MGSDLDEMRRATGAACPVTPTPTHSEKRGLAWVVGAFLICPCHLPLTMALATAVLAGTAAGVLLRAHPLAAGVLVTAAWAAGTWQGIRHLRPLGGLAFDRHRLEPRARDGSCLLRVFRFTSGLTLEVGFQQQTWDQSEHNAYPVAAPESRGYTPCS